MFSHQQKKFQYQEAQTHQAGKMGKCVVSLPLLSHTHTVMISLMRAVISQGPRLFRVGLQPSPNFQEVRMLSLLK
jgi:hypothetical protein